MREEERDMHPTSWEVGNCFPTFPLQSSAVNIRQKIMNKMAEINRD